MNGLRKLFFDDVRAAPDNTWMTARDVPEAKALMQKYAFDVMSLDHDIGMHMMCEECYSEIPKPITSVMLTEDKEVHDKLRLGCNHSEHGTHLAQWMLKNLDNHPDSNKMPWPELIIIHSANPYGAQRMEDLLRNGTVTMRIPYNREILQSVGSAR